MKGAVATMICIENVVPDREALVEAMAKRERDLIASYECPADILAHCADALEQRYENKGAIWISLPRMLSKQELKALQTQLAEKGWSFRKSAFWLIGDYKLKVGASFSEEAYNDLFSWFFGNYYRD